MRRSIYAHVFSTRVCFAIFRVNEDITEVINTISVTDTLNISEGW